MYDENDAWQKFRSLMLFEARKQEEHLLKQWLEQIGYSEPVGYYRNSFDHVMEIYATRIGALIGQSGVHVKELEDMLAQEYRGTWKVKFIEVRGGFVNV